jgi:hypothetical protein
MNKRCSVNERKFIIHRDAYHFIKECSCGWSGKRTFLNFLNLPWISYCSLRIHQTSNLLPGFLKLQERIFTIHLVVLKYKIFFRFSSLRCRLDIISSDHNFLSIHVHMTMKSRIACVKQS